MPTKSSGRRYGKAASKSVASAMRRRKKGTLKSGKAGKGGKVTNPKQAIAIGLSEARKKGAKVPARRKRSATSRSRSTTSRKRAAAASSRRTGSRSTARKKR